jgi:(2R)-sulfolactate sulfo-lyase subunit alpha
LQGTIVHYLIHDEKDDVGVAVVDIRAGQPATGRTLDTHKESSVKSLSDIPLGHKIALRDFKVGDTVTKYGQDIGKVVAKIKKGEHVHVHNLKTKRW